MSNEISTEVLWKGVVAGTPRTYGDRRTEDIWRHAIVAGRWEGTLPLQTILTPVHLDFEFRVNPQSAAYGRNVSCNGPDLDTMVIGALAGLLNSRNPDRPTLRLIGQGGQCKSISASKCLVDNDNQTGFTLLVRPGGALPFDESSNEAPLSFYVGRQSLKTDRRRAVQDTAEQANATGFRAPRNSRIEITLSFAEGLTRNPLSADWLEAVIDGLGASRVGSDRFFDGPSIQEFGYDDSVIYRLNCAHVQGMHAESGLHICTKNIFSASSM